MINIQKVTKEIHKDGRYDAILDVAKKTLNKNTPTLEEIENLVKTDEYYIKEYKDLNRWGELSSVHIKDLEVKSTDTIVSKELKEKINTEMVFLKNREEYQVASKNSIYATWTISIALPAIYIVDNMVRLFTDIYTSNNENSVYLSFVIVVILSTWGYLKMSRQHKYQHKKYIQTQQAMRTLIKDGLEKEYFTFDEVYED